MEKLFEELSDLNAKIKIRKNTETYADFYMEYKTDSAYGSIGGISVEVQKNDDGYSLVMIEITPMCKRSVICSFGRSYVSTSGYGIGCYNLFKTIEDVAKRIKLECKHYKLVE